MTNNGERKMNEILSHWLRSLADIQALVDKDKRIAELEKERDTYKEIARQHTEMASKGIYHSLEWLNQLNLVQRAKGVDDFADAFLHGDSLTDAVEYGEKLRKQAKGQS